MTILMHDQGAIKAGMDPHISKEKVTAGDCALFTLPHVAINGKNMVTNERAPISIPFRAKMLNGYCGEYTIRMGNGVTGVMKISQGGKHKQASDEYYVHDQLPTSVPAHGVLRNPGCDHIILTIRPDNNWLEPGQRFHVFKLAMAGHQPYTVNENHLPPFHTTDILFGIQRPG